MTHHMLTPFTSAATHQQSKDFAELASSVAQLSRRVGRVTGTPGALSDTERALAAAQVGTWGDS